MNWVTREHVQVDRGGLPVVDPEVCGSPRAVSLVPPDAAREVAPREGAIPYDAPEAELGHHEGKCSFEAIIAKYRITDPAVHLLAQIVHGPDVADDLYGRPEAAGLKAVAEGFRDLGLADDHAILDHEFIVYDALYAYCRSQAAG